MLKNIKASNTSLHYINFIPVWIELNSDPSVIVFSLRNTPHSDPDRQGTAIQFVSSGAGGNTIARIDFINPVDSTNNVDRSISITKTNGQSEEHAVFFSGQNVYQGSLSATTTCIWTVRIKGEWDAFTIRCGELNVLYNKQHGDLDGIWFDENIRKTNQLKFTGIKKFRYAGIDPISNKQIY